MLKLKGGLTLFFIVSLFSTGLLVEASDSPQVSPWISGSELSITKTADINGSDIPATFFNAGNLDCQISDDGHCAVGTTYGNVYSSSLWTGAKWKPIQDFGGNSNNYFGIPNSSTGLTTSAGPVFGNYMYLTDDIYSSLIPKYKTGAGGTTINGINNLILDHYQLNHAPDRRVQDKSGVRLAADMNSLAFSGNGKWMVYTDPNIANIRLNVTNGDVLPFGLPFTYGSGRNPVPKNAISSDGRYAVLAAEDSAVFRIYDLNTCDTVPAAITKAVSCQSRDLLNNGFINSNIPGFIGVKYIRFLDNDTISFYASYKEGASTKYAQYILTDIGSPFRQQYLALGDSYIAGEGTYKYINGTDTETNKCHVSLYSYPYTIGHDLSYDSYHSAACSGATTKDIIDTSPLYAGQADRDQGISRVLLDGQGLTSVYLANFTQGHLDQLDFVKTYKPKIITVSIGGNDMGFSKILQQCVDPRQGKPCFISYEDRLELINFINDTVFNNLVGTYSKIKKSDTADARIFAIGYPQIAKSDGDCAINVRLDKEEVKFSEQIIEYLDSVIKIAADKTGIYYVDTQDALNGHRLCETTANDIAVNGLTAGNDRPKLIGGPLGDESYHPNIYGYQLLEADILKKTENLTAPMPAPDPSVTLPPTDGLDILNIPHSGRQIKDTQYDPGISPDLAYRGTAVDVKIVGASHLMTAGSTLQAELHSEPIALGSFNTTAGGNISADVMIPNSVPTGYHELHFYGQDVNGLPIDIYKYIYIANTADDMDGDGVLDSAQACVGIPASGIDYDMDGIDDACDGEITQPPQTGENKILASNPGAKDFSNKLSSDTQNFVPLQDQAAEISIADSSSPNESSGQPKVLAAETHKLAPIPIGGSSNRNSFKKHLALVGVGSTALSIASYSIKRRLFI